MNTYLIKEDGDYLYQENSGPLLSSPDEAVDLIGVAGTSAIQTIVVLFALALSNADVLGTGSVGTLTASSPSETQVALTGEQATGSVGTLTPGFSLGLVGEQATGSSGTLIATESVGISGTEGIVGQGSVTFIFDLTLIGLQATGGDGLLSPAFQCSLSGIEAAGQLGTIIGAQEYFAALTGLSATNEQGSISPTLSPSLIGEVATGQLGSCGISFNFSIVGESATGSVGTLTATEAEEAALTGVSGTGQLGSVGVSSSLGLTGLFGTGAVGDVIASEDNFAALSGNAANGSPGLVTIGFECLLRSNYAIQLENGDWLVQEDGGNLFLEDPQASGSLGTLTSNITKAITGEQATGSIGTLNVGVNLSGVSCSGQQGNLSPSDICGLSGVQGNGAVGSLIPDFQIAIGGNSAAGSIGILSVEGANDVTRELSGVAATGAVGDLGHENGGTIPLIGIGATGQITGPIADISITVTTVLGNGAVGSLSQTHSNSLTGVVGATEQGVIFRTQLADITGQAATGQIGNESPSITIGLIGIERSAELGDPAVLGENDIIRPITGVEAQARLGNLIFPGAINAPGSYQPVINVPGSYQPTITISGSYAPEIRNIPGSFDDGD